MATLLELAGYDNGALDDITFDEALMLEDVSPDSELASWLRSVYGQESGSGSDTSTSHAGARGHMQIVPGTFAGVADEGWDINNPEHNMRGGIRYGVEGWDAAGGDPRLASIYYYSGPRGLQAARRGEARYDPINPDFPSSFEYADQVVARMGGAGATPRGEPSSRLARAQQRLGLQLPGPEAEQDEEMAEILARWRSGRTGAMQPAPEPPPEPVEEDGLWDHVRNTALGLGIGTNAVIGSIASTVMPESTFVEVSKAVGESLADTRTEAYQRKVLEASQRAAEAYDEAGGGKSGVAASTVQILKDVAKNPSLGVAVFAETLPSILAMGGAAVVGTALGGPAGGVAGLMAANAAMDFGGTRQQQYDRMVEELVKQGYSEEEASEFAAEESLNARTVGAGLYGAAVAPLGIGGTFLSRADRVARNTGARVADVVADATDTALRRTLPAAARRGGIEFAAQTGEAVIPTVAGELAARDINPDVDIGRPIGESLGFGIVAGLPFGLAAGKRESSSQRAMARRIGDALADPELSSEARGAARNVIINEARRRGTPEAEIQQWVRDQDVALGLVQEEAPAAPETLLLGNDPSGNVVLPDGTVQTLYTFPDGSTGTRADLDAYLASLPEDQQIQERARLLGMGPQPSDATLAQERDLLREQENQQERRQAAGLRIGLRAEQEDWQGQLAAILGRDVVDGGPPDDAAGGGGLPQLGPVSPLPSAAMPPLVQGGPVSPVGAGTPLPQGVAQAGQQAQQVMAQGGAFPQGVAAPLPRGAESAEAMQRAAEVRDIAQQQAAEAARTRPSRPAMPEPVETTPTPVEPAVEPVGQRVRTRADELLAEEQATRDAEAGHEATVEAAATEAGMDGEGGRRKWSSVGKRARALFTRLFDAREQGLIDDEQYTEMTAPLVARGAAAVADVTARLEGAFVQNQIREAEAADMAATRERSAAANEAREQRRAARAQEEAPAAPAEPAPRQTAADTRLRERNEGRLDWLYDDEHPVGKVLNRISEQVQESSEGKRQGLGPQDRVRLALLMGRELDGTPRATTDDGTTPPVDIDYVAEQEAVAMGRDTPVGRSAISNTLARTRAALPAEARRLLTASGLDNLVAQGDPGTVAATAEAVDTTTGFDSDGTPVVVTEEPSTTPDDAETARAEQEAEADEAPVSPAVERQQAVMRALDLLVGREPVLQQRFGDAEGVLSALRANWANMNMQETAPTLYSLPLDSLSPAQTAAIAKGLADAIKYDKSAYLRNAINKVFQQVLGDDTAAINPTTRLAEAMPSTSKWAAGLDAVFSAMEGMAPSVVQFLRRNRFTKRHALAAVRLSDGMQLEVYKAQSKAEQRMLDAIRNSAFATLTNSSMDGALRWAEKGVNGIGWFDGESVRNAPAAVYVPKTGEVLMNTRLATSVLGRSQADSAAAMVPIAVTLGHEMGHAMSDQGGKAIGLEHEATQEPASPFNVRVEASDSGVTFEMGPVARELYDLYRSEHGDDGQGTAGLPRSDEGAAERAVPRAGRDVRRTADAGAVRDDGTGGGPTDGGAPVGDGRPVTARAQRAASQDADGRGPGREDGVAASGVPANSGWVEGLSLTQPFFDVAQIEAMVESGTFDASPEGVARAVEAASAAAEEAWTHALEGYLVDPEHMKRVAPLAHALVEEALRSRTPTRMGNVLSGRSNVRGVPPATPTPRRRPVRRASQKAPTEQPVRARAATLPRGSTGGIAQAVQDAIGSGRLRLSDLKSAAVRHGALTSDLARVASRVLPSAKKWWDQSIKVRALQQQYDLRTTDITNRFNRIKAGTRKQVNTLLRDSTLRGEWAFQPEYLQNQQAIAPDLAARFAAIKKADPRAAKIVQDIFKHNRDQYTEMRKQALSAIVSEYDTQIAAARKAGDGAQARSLERRKLQSDSTFSILADVDPNRPYTPLARFGDHVVVAKSEAYLAQEDIAENTDLPDAVRAKAREELKTMRPQPQHYYVAFRDGRGEARSLANKLREQGTYANVDSMARDVDQYGAGRDMLGTFRRLQRMVEDSADERLSGAANGAMRQLMADMNLALLSQESARHAFQNRENIAGFEEDMVRAFESRSRAAAAFTASISDSGAMADIIADMRKEVRRGDLGTREERQDFFNEIVRRHTMGMDYRPSRLVSRALAATSAWSLTNTPSYYITNLTQPWAMSLPWMAGRHGWGVSARELGRAQGEVVKLLKDGLLKRREDGGFDLRVEDFKALPTDVREAMEHLATEGIMLVTLSNDMGRWGVDGEAADMGTLSRAATKGSHLVSNVTFRMRRASEMVEAVNRLSTAMAAYRLAKNDSSHTQASRETRAKDAAALRKENPDWTDAQVQEQLAVDYATEVLNATHGDYMDLNRPRLLRTKLGKLAFQFRVFQLIQASMFIRVAAQAFAGASPQERAIGRRALGYTFGHMAAFGGAIGLPGFVTADFLATMLAQAFGDDDERAKGGEERIRELVGDNETLATLLTRGVPAAFLGADTSMRMAGGTAFSQIPFTDAEVSREGWRQMVTDSMGPFLGGIVPNAAEGINQMRQGRYWRGVELMVPRVVRDMSRAMRHGSEGVTSPSGEQRLPKEEMNLVHAAWQALGFQPTPLAEHYQQRGVEFQDEAFFRDRTSRITESFVKARAKNDMDGAAKARKDFLKLQESRVASGLKRQPLSNLNAAWKRRQTADRAAASR